MGGDFGAARVWAWRLALGTGAMLLVAGCGGESQRVSPEPANEPAAAVINPLPDCVPVGDGQACPALGITIDPTVEGPVCAPGGFTIEPLQVPDFSNGASRNPPPTEPDPAKWDRSVLPAGAWVVRLHGLRASCYPVGRFYTDSCSAGSPILPGSFYETHCSEVPGCSTPEKLAYSARSDGYDASGFWWYLNDRGDSALDVVVCAPEVSSFAYGGCLVLDPGRRCGKL